MLVTSLSLRDFRNYGRADVELAPGLNVVCGPNGAGKTNLLEAVYFALTARSCRTSNEREVVRSGEKVARVSAQVRGEKPCAATCRLSSRLVLPAPFGPTARTIPGSRSSSSDA